MKLNPDVAKSYRRVDHPPIHSVGLPGIFLEDVEGACRPPTKWAIVSGGKILDFISSGMPDSCNFHHELLFYSEKKRVFTQHPF